MRRRTLLKQMAAGTLVAPALIGIHSTLWSRRVRAAGKAPSMVFIGDSIFAACNDGAISADGTYLSNNAHGELVWAWMMDPRFKLDNWLTADGRPTMPYLKTDGSNQGVNGTTIYRLNQDKEIEHVRSLDPDVVVIGFGANDIPLGVTLRQYQRAMTSFCDKMIGDGRKVVVATIRPHVGKGAAEEKYNYPPGDPKWEAHFAFNDWITNDLPGKYGDSLAVWDTFTPLADPNSHRGAEFLPYATRDGVHINEIGARLSANTLSKVLKRMLPAGTYFDADLQNGNLLPNARLGGSSGHAGPGVSGLVPDETVAMRMSGDHQEITFKTGDKGLRLTFAGRSQPGVEQFSFSLQSDSSLPVSGIGGRRVQLYVPISIPASKRMRSASIYLADDTAQHRVEGMRAMDRNNPHWPNQPFDGWLISPPLQLPANASGVRAAINIKVAEGTDKLPIDIGGAKLSYV